MTRPAARACVGPWLLAAALATSLGCRRTESAAVEQRETGVAPRPAHCVPRTAEKLGVSFLHVCDDPDRSFWISATPIGCSAGDHDTLRCPPTVALARRHADGGPVPASARTAAVVEAETAHQVCTMRFAGRLPTREERVRARAAHGLSTLVVSESSEARVYRLRELAEWVTQQACERPTLLAPECGAARFPWGSTANVVWRDVVACDQRPAESIEGRTVVDVGGDCALLPLPANGPQSAERRALPCVVRGSADETDGGALGVELTCGRPAAVPRHGDVIADVAAFRCVLAEWR